MCSGDNPGCLTTNENYCGSIGLKASRAWTQNVVGGEENVWLSGVGDPEKFVWRQGCRAKGGGGGASQSRDRGGGGGSAGGWTNTLGGRVKRGSRSCGGEMCVWVAGRVGGWAHKASRGSSLKLKKWVVKLCVQRVRKGGGGKQSVHYTGRVRVNEVVV